MSNAKWLVLIAVLWTGMFGYSFVQSNLPASWWYVADHIRVEQVSDGRCPAMCVDREIKRPFSGRWVVTIMKRNQEGRWVTHRIFRGYADYRPGNALPTALDLCWWAGVHRLDLPPGSYRVHTLWQIEPEVGGAREVRRSSNVFEVSG